MHSRVTSVHISHAQGQVLELFESIRKRVGIVPNMMRAMASAPAVLSGFVHTEAALGRGRLSSKQREQIAIAVAQANQSEYCLAAHTTIGVMVGLTHDQIRDSRLGVSSDNKTDAILRFARAVLENRGRVSCRDLDGVRDAGFDDGVITEIVAHVAFNIFTNYFNHVARTKVDYPPAPVLRSLGAF